MKRCCSEDLGLERAEDLRLDAEESFSALRTPFSAMFQKSEELSVTNANR